MLALLAVAGSTALALVVAPGTASAITGGTVSGPGDQPFVAEVIYTPTGGFCTGTLIHPRWVLTAQHCAETVPANTLTVRVNNSTRGTGGTLSQVTEIRKLPGYAGGHNDLALLRLSNYITTVPTLRLASPAEAFRWDGAQGDQGTATGWGVDAAGAYPSQLQRRAVNITTPAPDNLGIKRIMLSSAGPCGGDSGGPLIVTGNGGVRLQVGVLKAAACGSPGASYSEVGAGTNRDWVLAQIPDISAPNPLTCKQGYVWRNAYSGDATCVVPAQRTLAAQDNAAAPYRVNPYGAYGPNTCISGYVWRVARPSDLVCVTPATRSQVAADNSAAASRVN